MPYPSLQTLPSPQMTPVAGPAPAPPAAPGGLTATVAGQQVTLAWGSVTGATGYRAYRNGVLVYDGSATGYVDTPAIGTYGYTVTAFDGGGESGHSAQVTAFVFVIAVDATPPGLNATHTWYPAGGGPAVVLNPAPTGVLPRVRLTGEIAGWGNPPSGDDRRTIPVGRVLAERPLRSGRHGKTLTYQGVVEARHDIELRNATGALARAFGDPNMGEGRMVVAPWDGRPPVEYMARVTGYDCPEAYPAISALGRRSRGFERGFTLQVHLSRGRMFSTVLRNAWSSGPAGITITVGGNAPTEPTIIINDLNPGYVQVRNFTHDVLLRLEDVPPYLLPDNAVLTIDFAARTLIASGPMITGTGNARIHLRYDLSTWWRSGEVGLRPGAQTITHAGDGGAMTVQWKDAWW